MTTPSDFDRAYDYIKLHHASNDFYRSLLEQFERKGVLSEKQILAVLRGIERDRTNATTPEHEPVTEVGMYRTANGTIYRVKYNRDGTSLYAMRYTPEAESGQRFTYEGGAIRKLSANDRMTLDEAKAIGIASGVCCVCGIELTDPKSVERGIGPVCIKRV